jgi:hypothetical protein
MDIEYAIHEAGHAVAAGMRGAEVRSIHETDDGAITNVRGKSWDMPFITFGGLWAEARYWWSLENPDAPETMATMDANGIEFFDYITSVLISQPDDATALGDTPDVLRDVWHMELTRSWDDIIDLATTLTKENN